MRIHYNSRNDDRWLVPIFNTGYKKDLEFDDLMQCSDVDDPAYVTSRIEGYVYTFLRMKIT